MLRIFLDYLYATFWHWWLLIAFGLAAVIDLYERATGKSLHIPVRVKYVVLILLLILAPFLAYHDLRLELDVEREQKIHAQGQVERLQGELAVKNETITTLRDQVAELVSRPPQIQIPPS
ncbi:hypothetical protein MYX77_03640 [Acidobacteriia bacterium AH_259_A11_L15]|nr:hypothetical protein [Acidobacteriia bacterium AH_259_A11_L15]